MKKQNFKKVLFLILGVLVLTGCATQLKYSEENQEKYYTEQAKKENEQLADETEEAYNTRIAEIVQQQLSENFDTKNDSKTITIKETGQVLTKNVLCRGSEEIEEYYQKNLSEEELKAYNELPTCENFKLTSGGYEGVWTSIIVKPLAWLIIQFGNIFKNYGVGLILASLLIRLVIFPISKKTALQSELMKQAKPELDKLEKKYAGKTDRDAMMKKSNEMALIYRKYNIKPIAGCLFALIQIPLFIGFYEAIQRVPAIFEGSLLGFQLGTTPLTGISNGNLIYLILSVCVGVTTYFSLSMNAADMSKNSEGPNTKSMTKVMFFLILIMSFIMTSALNIYWITTNLFTVVQNVIVRRKKV